MDSTDREHAGLTSDAALLLATAGGPGMDDRIRALAGSVVDWTRFLQLAAQERSESVVSRRLASLGVALPPAVDRELKTTALRADVRMARLSQRLDETLVAYQQAGIPVMLLKGAALGKTVYGYIPLRPMLDLDVLVPVPQGEQALQVAVEQGWAHTDLSQLTEFYREHHHLPPLVDARSRLFNLELHTGLMASGHPFAWPVEELWANAVTLPDGRAQVPSVTDLMLHNVVHFAWSHMMRFGPWRAFRDLEAMLPRVDWDAFIVAARKRKAASAAYWTFALARQYAGVAVPAEVEKSLAPPLVVGSRGPLLRHFAQQWFPAELSCPSRRLELTLWSLAIRPKLSGHGPGRPWSRDQLLIDRLHEPPETFGRKLLRHIATGGRYTRYLSRIALGRS